MVFSSWPGACAPQSSPRTPSTPPQICRPRPPKTLASHRGPLLAYLERPKLSRKAPGTGTFSRIVGSIEAFSSPAGFPARPCAHIHAQQAGNSSRRSPDPQRVAPTQRTGRSGVGAPYKNPTSRHGRAARVDFRAPENRTRSAAPTGAHAAPAKLSKLQRSVPRGPRSRLPPPAWASSYLAEAAGQAEKAKKDARLSAGQAEIAPKPHPAQPARGTRGDQGVQGRRSG